jgi:hypothetical protein
MVMPGDNVAVTIELITPIAMEEKLRFAIREGGRTVVPASSPASSSSGNPNRSTARAAEGVRLSPSKATKNPFDSGALGRKTPAEADVKKKM